MSDEEDQATLVSMLYNHFDRLNRSISDGAGKGWLPKAIIVAGPSSLFYDGASAGRFMGLDLKLGDTIEGPEIQWDKYTVWPVPPGVRVA